MLRPVGRKPSWRGIKDEMLESKVIVESQPIRLRVAEARKIDSLRTSVWMSWRQDVITQLLWRDNRDIGEQLHSRVASPFSKSAGVPLAGDIIAQPNTPGTRRRHILGKGRCPAVIQERGIRCASVGIQPTMIVAPSRTV